LTTYCCIEEIERIYKSSKWEFYLKICNVTISFSHNKLNSNVYIFKIING